MLSKLRLCFIFPVLLVFQVCFSQGVPTPARERLKAFDQRRLQSNASLLNKISFRSIGPSVMSGRVVDVDVNPADPTEFYVAYATGGLWHTINNGQSFTPLFDSADVITIGDIAVNWSTGTIWVGTGEANSSRSSYAGVGVYKSTDKGKTWRYLGLPESQHIGKIQLHPTDDNTAWVAVLGHLYTPNKERGIYKTTDGGNTWKQTLYVDENTGAVDLDINPKRPNELYAAMWYRVRKAWNFEEAGKTSGIYKSEDGGETWALLSKPGSGFPAGEGVGRIGLAVFPEQPEIVYAVLDNNFHKPDTGTKKVDTLTYELNDFEKITKEGFAQLNPKRLDTFFKRHRLFPRYNAQMVMERVSNGTLKPNAIWDYFSDENAALFNTKVIGCEVYRSENGGVNWKKMNKNELPRVYNTYGYYFGKIYVSPYDDQKLVITGFEIDQSRDGGKTFSRINTENVHADHHACWIDPKRDSHMIIGNDGGCNITYDNGEHWFKANTPAVGQFYSVTVDDARPYNVYGGLQDNGVWAGPSTNKDNYAWFETGAYPYKSIMGGDGMQVQVDTRDNATVYTGFQFGNYYRLNRLRPNDDMKAIMPASVLGEEPLRFNWQTPVVISKHNQDVIYFGANRLFRSFNKADTLVPISPDLTRGTRAGDVPFGTITTISESPFYFGMVYVGTDDGNIQLTRDGGFSWELLDPAPTKKAKRASLPENLWVSRITASRYQQGRAYLALNGYRNDDFSPYLYVSDDFGRHWTALGMDLPKEPVNVVKEDPKNEHIVYAGTDGGVYVSFDEGKHFMLWNAGLPYSIPVHDIAFQERENEIVVATHGRSLYIAKLDGVQGLQQDRDWLKKHPLPDAAPKKDKEDEGHKEEGMID